VRQPILSDAQRPEELFEEHLSGMDGIELLGHRFSS
jgi:hypothetical protein